VTLLPRCTTQQRRWNESSNDALVNGGDEESSQQQIRDLLQHPTSAQHSFRSSIPSILGLAGSSQAMGGQLSTLETFCCAALFVLFDT
jgi:hypothetical protein